MGAPEPRQKTACANLQMLFGQCYTIAQGLAMAWAKGTIRGSTIRLPQSLCSYHWRAYGEEVLEREHTRAGCVACRLHTSLAAYGRRTECHSIACALPSPHGYGSTSPSPFLFSYFFQSDERCHRITYSHGIAHRSVRRFNRGEHRYNIGF